MAVVGYNFYLDGVKVNDAPLPSPTYAFAGLASNTDYSARIKATAVDAAGNESPMSAALPPGTAATPAHAAGDQLSPVDQAAIDTIVAESMTESTQPGVIIQITGPRGNYAKAYGTTVDGSRPLTVDDHFRVGSTTKSFVRTAFLMAMDQGRVSLDDTLEQYVPGVPNGRIITMRDLLSMRSGLADYISNLSVAILFTLFPTWGWTDTQVDALSIIKSTAPLGPPNTQFQYVNTNFVLLGMVLQAVDPAHRHVRDILTQDIIVPLGLTETTWPRNSSIPVPAASSAGFNPELFGAAGAITSTVGDLTKWTIAMRDKALISDEAWELWTSWFWANDTGWGPLAWNGEFIPLKFGYGLAAENEGSWYGHPGAMPSFNTVPMFDKVSGATIVISENKATTKPIMAAQVRLFTRIALHLYPESMFDPTYSIPAYSVKPAGIPSAESFGATRVFRWAPNGDVEGTTQVPHKVPYTV